MEDKKCMCRDRKGQYIFVYMYHTKSIFTTSRLRQFMCCDMSPTLDVFQCLLATNMTALHWAISS